MILSPPVLQWPRRRAGFTFFFVFHCGSADENGECSCCMQAKQCYHNGMVILKAPPQFLDHYEGGEPGQRPIKWNLLSVFLGRSEAEQTVCYFGCLAQTDDGRKSTIQCFAELSRETKDTQEDFLPLPSLIRCDPFQPTTRAPSRSLIQFSYLPPLCRASSFRRSFTWACRCFWWLEHSPRCAKTTLPIIIWQVFFFFFFKKTIGTEFSVCGSQVNTELLSLSFCQSNIQP